MRYRIGAVLLLLLIFAQPFSAAGQALDTLVPDISLTGQQLKVLEIAAAESRKHGLDVLQYTVSIYRQERTYVVMFRDPSFTDRRALRGSSPNMLEFMVVIGADLKVLRASFVR